MFICLCCTQVDLDREAQDREEEEDRLILRIQESINRVRSQIEQEKKAREETQDEILRMMDDIVKRLKDAIDVRLLSPPFFSFSFDLCLNIRDSCYFPHADNT